ncbi:hypothetical protein B0H10DRAFT_932253 [Mycena sp. CBHHK59/15]|nr:hypothetical protein B0H10DRAFT_932253 [Mycena sp. CBHHK59/15]
MRPVPVKLGQGILAALKSGKGFGGASRGLPKPTASGVKHEFLECDATLMKNVKRAAADILVRFGKANFLVNSAGFLSLKGLDLTEEGIDRKPAVMYYGRWKFIHDLLPGLRSAKATGEDTRMMAIFSAGNGLKTRFSAIRAVTEVTLYLDVMIENFAAREPDMMFIHAHPGFVNTRGSESALLRASSYILRPIFSPLRNTPETCGEFQMYTLLHAGAGASRTNGKAESIGDKGYHVTEAARKKLWEHTVEATTV